MMRAAAEAAFAALQAGRAGDTLSDYDLAYAKSAVAKDLWLVRNAKPLLTRFGDVVGGFIGTLDIWTTYLTGGFSLLGGLDVAHVNEVDDEIQIQVQTSVNKVLEHRGRRRQIVIMRSDRHCRCADNQRKSR